MDSLFARADALFAYSRYKHAEFSVDRHCIARALAEVGPVPTDFRVSVNAHASTLGHCADFTSWLCELAASHGLEPTQLTVEVVELSPDWDKLAFRRTLDELRHASIKIALDDVGLGHSNYQMMLDMRPDYFKIDRYFVHGCGADPYRHAVVASIAKLAAELGGMAVAEGWKFPKIW